MPYSLGTILAISPCWNLNLFWVTAPTCIPFDGLLKSQFAVKRGFFQRYLLRFYFRMNRWGTLMCIREILAWGRLRLADPGERLPRSTGSLG